MTLTFDNNSSSGNTANIDALNSAYIVKVRLIGFHGPKVGIITSFCSQRSVGAGVNKARQCEWAIPCLLMGSCPVSSQWPF